VTEKERGRWTWGKRERDIQQLSPTLLLFLEDGSVEDARQGMAGQVCWLLYCQVVQHLGERRDIENKHSLAYSHYDCRGCQGKVLDISKGIALLCNWFTGFF
jgi:hypothetical protein